MHIKSIVSDEDREELFDISIIVGNLMDNAIRGTAASDERRVSLQMYDGK